MIFRLRSPSWVAAVQTLHVSPCSMAQTVTSLLLAQDYPGRTGFWHVGVPPSGPMDAAAFRLANALVGNPEDAAGLEVTLSGALLLLH